MKIRSKLLLTFLLAALLPFAVLSAPGRGRAEGPAVVELTQTPCTILESEVNPRRFVSKSAADCKRINRETAAERRFKPLHLKPGKTIFRVLNKNVPYELGFWVRGKGIARATLPSVSGGGLMEGQTKEYVIELEPGEYLYSCPLNPTPDYPLIVR